VNQPHEDDAHHRPDAEAKGRYDMLRSVYSIFGHHLHARDGVVGKVGDFFFDDRSWIVRYLVADSGIWLKGRQVLIAPQALGIPNWEANELPVDLTTKQIENSPAVTDAMAVVREHEEKLHNYFGWQPYWELELPQSPGLAEARARSAEQQLTHEQTTSSRTNATAVARRETHLRSAREVMNYGIEASDGQIGHVEDFIVDCGSWAIRYMVVDTRNWLPGKKVLVAPQWVDTIDWPEQTVMVDLTRQQIKTSPEFDPHSPINREYEEHLFDFYGRPTYW
jgi:stress response protein YsnF